jgi:hypothetical protein
MLLLEPHKKGSKPTASPTEHEDRAPVEEERRFLCRVCENTITDSSQLFCMRAATVQQVFPNPYGQMRVIMTAKHAQSVAVIGEATSDFTWFAGYSWRVVYCAECRSHLGWLFEANNGRPEGDLSTVLELDLPAGSPRQAVGPETIRSFYGLLVEALVEG